MCLNGHEGVCAELGNGTETFRQPCAVTYMLALGHELRISPELTLGQWGTQPPQLGPPHDQLYVLC